MDFIFLPERVFRATVGTERVARLLSEARAGSGSNPVGGSDGLSERVGQ